MELIEKLIFLMKRENIKTTAQLSRETNIPYTTLKSIFDGDVNDIRLSTSRKLCNFFKITLDELLDDTISLESLKQSSKNAIDIAGLSEEDLKDVQEYVNFKKSKKTSKK